MDEESKLHQAICSKDRNTIRGIMAARQARETARSDDVMVDETEQDSDANNGDKNLCFEVDMFSCPICHNLLHKPCINACGHAFCFWCLHQAMNFAGSSKCALCRAPFLQFAAPFSPLHYFLHRAFPEEAARREEEVAEQEREMSTQSPNMTKIKTDKKTETLSGALVDVEELLCVSCHNIVKEPIVAVGCGHLICKDCVINNSTIMGSGESPPPNMSCPECSTPILDSGLNVCSLLQGLLESVTDVQRLAMPSAAGLSSAELSLVQSPAEEPVPIPQEPAIPFEPPEIPIPQEHVMPLEPPQLPSDDKFVHFGVGCDGCGQFPISGRAFRCLNCPESIGYDICKACFLRGVHLKPNSGRFNQSHESTHTLKEIAQVPSDLHRFMDLHPEMTPAEIFHFIGQHE